MAATAALRHSQIDGPRGENLRCDVVVVGGGTAGCVVAARLAEEFDLSVVLVERGALSLESATDPFPAIASGEGVETVQVRARENGPIRGYTVARRLGGGGAVNGMLAENAPAEDFDRWVHEFGCAGWAWDDLGRERDWVASRVATTLSPSGAVGAALADAVSARPATIWWRESSRGRLTSTEFLPGALASGHLQIISGEVTAVSAENDNVEVVLADGRALHARRVVLCAGTFANPRLLHSAGVRHAGLGAGVMDHPALTVAIDRGPDRAGAGRPPVSMVADLISGSDPARRGQILAFEHLDASRRWSGLIVALHSVTARGAIDPEARSATVVPVLGVLGTESDRIAFCDLVRQTTEIAGSLAVRSLGESFVDAAGTTVDDLARLGRSDLERWVLDNVGLLSHAVGSCAMGINGVVDPRGRVRTRRELFVADASLMPHLVSVPPNVTVAVVAARIAALVAEDFS